MKKILPLFVMALAMMMPQIAKAYDFKVGTICYNIIDAANQHVAVVEGTLAPMNGKLVIPSYVTYEGDTYKVKSIAKEAIIYNTALISVVVGDGVTSIGDFAISYCTNLRELSLPNSVKEIGPSAFAYNQTLSSVILPKNLEKIEQYTFLGCSALSYLVIPAKVSYIGKQAFQDCPLDEVYNYAETPQMTGSKAFSFCNALHVKPGCKEAYEEASPWSEFAITDDLTEEIVNGISGVIDNQIAAQNMYDLAGRKMSAPRGLYIHGGKVRMAK